MPNSRLLLLLFACFFIGCSTVDRRPSGQPSELPSEPTEESSVAVPLVSGLALQVAQESLLQTGLVIAFAYCDTGCMVRGYGRDIDAWPVSGIVLSQRPGPGEFVTFADTVNLVVANWSVADLEARFGPRMPDLVADSSQLGVLRSNNRIDVESSVLDARQLKRRFGPDRTRWPKAGAVISQSPEAGTWIWDSRIQVEQAGTWSDQPDDVTGLSRAQAEDALKQLGFSTRVTELDAKALAARYGQDPGAWPVPGTVIDQREETRNKETEVVLSTASWQTLSAKISAIGDLRGLSLEAASARLDAIGISYEVKPNDANDNPLSVADQTVLLAEDATSVLVSLDVVQQSGADIDATKQDSDRDSVIDAGDDCPGTAIGEVVDANGCSAVQLAKYLETGLYTFDPGTRSMSAENTPPYKVSIALQTAMLNEAGFRQSPSPSEFEALEEATPAQIEAAMGDNVDDGTLRFTRRWAGRMTIKLKARDGSTATIVEGEKNIEKRLIERGITVWTWSVTPHCVSALTSPFDCEPLVLEATAIAHLGQDGGLPYSLFADQEIRVAIDGGTLLGLAWRDNKELVLGSIFIPLLGAGLIAGWRRLRAT